LALEGGTHSARGLIADGEILLNDSQVARINEYLCRGRILPWSGNKQQDRDKYAQTRNSDYDVFLTVHPRSEVLPIYPDEWCRCRR
jgi:hypothetical protein